MVEYQNIFVFICISLTNYLLIRAAKTFWKNSIKETFCVDSSIHMNNLALALLQDGVRNSAVESTMDPAAAKGLYFRQFMPISDAVNQIFFQLKPLYFKKIDIPRSSMILLFVHIPC